MAERLKEIFSLLPECESFADVGCDHGYIAEAMLKSGKCKRAVMSDVSEKCLEKAKKLNAEFIKNGVAEAVLSDGLKKVPRTECVLIAGMGGEEIIKILSESPFVPEKILLQPMKNADKVRVYIAENGYKILKDYIFFAEGKYYVLILAERGADKLTAEEAEFGRTNLQNPSEAFVRYIKEEIARKIKFSSAKGLSEEKRAEFLNDAERLKKYADVKRTL